jgi:hypothetical protein
VFLLVDNATSLLNIHTACRYRDIVRTVQERLNPLDRRDWDVQMKSVPAHRLADFHQAQAVGLESLNHYLACIEAARMAAMVAPMTADKWNAFRRALVELRDLVPARLYHSLTSHDGVMVQSPGSRSDRRNAAPAARVTNTSVGQQGLWHMKNYVRDRGVREGAKIQLVVRRVPVSSKATYRFSVTDQGPDARGDQPILPNVYVEGQEWTYTLYPLQVAMIMYEMGFCLCCLFADH